MGENVIVRDYLMREIVKVMIRFVCAIGLAYLAIKYGIFKLDGMGTVDTFVGKALVFCVAYFICSIFQYCLQYFRYVLMAIVIGFLLMAFVLSLLRFVPEALQGYVFIGVVLFAALCDILRMIIKIKAIWQ